MTDTTFEPPRPGRDRCDAAAPCAAEPKHGGAAGPRHNRVLVVDDEPELRAMLSDYLGRNGFEVRTAADADAARRILACGQADIALLDVNMPGENGLSIARWLRQAHPRVGIVIVTTAGDAVDRIVGLEVGADDYLSKPFEPRELLARVRALQRRLGADALPDTSPRRVRFGACQLDLLRRCLFGADGQEIEISGSEFDLLACFARHPNLPLTRDQIMEQAHRRGWEVFDRSIDLRIMRLRRKIEAHPDRPEVLKTVRNVGYVFVSPP